MTALKFANKIRTYTKQTSTSLTDADILLLANPIKDSLAELIATRDIKGNYFILPTLGDLVANQREYAWPDDVLDHIYSVEVAFSSTTDSFGQLKYVQAFPDDYRRLGLSRIEANIQANYSNVGGSVSDSFNNNSGRVVGPRYEIQRRAIYLLSGAIDSTTIGGATVTNGVRIRYRAYPADLTAVSDNSVDLSIDPSATTFGMPRQFHELWARACSIEWKAAHPGAVPASSLDARYDIDLEEKLGGIENNNMSDEIIATIPADNGYRY